MIFQQIAYKPFLFSLLFSSWAVIIPISFGYAAKPIIAKIILFSIAPIGLYYVLSLLKKVTITRDKVIVESVITRRLKSFNIDEVIFCPPQYTGQHSMPFPNRRLDINSVSSKKGIGSLFFKSAQERSLMIDKLITLEFKYRVKLKHL